MNSWDSQIGKQNALAMNSMMGQVHMSSNFMVQENNSINMPPMKPPPMPSLIGPVLPDENANPVSGFEVPTKDMEIQSAEAESSTQNYRRNSRDRSHGDKRDRNRDRRHRSRSHERNNRNDNRNNNRSNHNRHNRPTKWDNAKERTEDNAMPMMSAPNMMMSGNMMPYNNMMHGNMMVPQQMGVQIPNMMPGMDMMPNMMSNMMPNMVPNMMDPNMMMMNQQIMPVMPNQQIYLSFGSLLPPIPGNSIPERRERPRGCRTIVVGGLPSNITNEMVMEIFQRFGEIKEVKLPKYLQGQGIRHVRFASSDQMEQAFFLSGNRIKFHDQMDNEAMTMYIDYAVNREDESEYERNQRNREETPPRVEQFSPNGLSAITEKIKNEEEFTKVALTLAVWLERGECNKRNANHFYSLAQASNNHFRRLFNEKMQLEEEYQNLKAAMKEKFAHVVKQFEQVVKILTAAKHQRVSDHFSKQQRRNIEMWLKMSEDVENIKEEFYNNFDEDENEKAGSSKNIVPQEKYEALKTENENLMYELEGYKNEAFLAKDEAERKFEKFKAHFIAQQALMNKQAYPSIPSTDFMTESKSSPKPKVPTPQPKIDEDKVETSGPPVPASEAKLISILTAFLLVHPLGASLDYLVSYVRSLTPNVTQATVHQILQKYSDVFCCTTSGVGASIEHRWKYVTFDAIKKAD